jgi:GMP synthase (glutamine-hydrolysing)
MSLATNSLHTTHDSHIRPVWVVRHVAHEGLGTIADALSRCEVPWTTIDAFAGSFPQFNPHEIAGLVVMGGPMNVDEVDKHPFLAEEVRWLRQAVDAQLPVLGVCLGSQLLAKSLGRKVYANRVKEIGWYDIEILPTAATDPLLHDIPRQATVFQWHGDTFDLPAGAVQLARSPQCENQAFRFGQRAFGLQFHMEVTAEIIDDWLCQFDNCGELAGLSYIDPAAIRWQTPEKLPQMEAVGRQVFDRFAKLCRSGS